MALNRQPAIATVPMILTPEDRPIAKTFMSKTPIPPKSSPMQPIIVKLLPTKQADILIIL